VGRAAKRKQWHVRARGGAHEKRRGKTAGPKALRYTNNGKQGPALQGLPK
jgi:hypothetical protein